MAVVTPLLIACPVCNAAPGKPCNAPTEFSRRDVRWFHMLREDRSAELNNNRKETQMPNEDKNIEDNEDKDIIERCWLRDRIAAAIVHKVSVDYPTWAESLALADVVIQELGLVRDPFGAPDPFGTFTFHRYVTKWVLTPEEVSATVKVV